MQFKLFGYKSSSIAHKEPLELAKPALSIFNYSLRVRYDHTFIYTRNMKMIMDRTSMIFDMVFPSYGFALPW